MKMTTKIKIIMGVITPIAAIISGNFQVAQPVEAQPVDTARPTPVAKKAMTWVTRQTKIVSGKTYALVGSDNVITNPYKGDTPISQSLPILCIKKANLPKPTFNLGSARTPGGAWTATWSGGYIGLTPPVLGNTLTSLSVANNICARSFGTGYRMAEFHDGNSTGLLPPGAPGWTFWGEVVPSSIKRLTQDKLRFWVSINDQPANPW